MSSAQGTTRSRRYRKQKKVFIEQCKALDLPCWLCGQPIDYDVPHSPSNRDCFELDHLYPRSTHPHLAEDPANFRPSHNGCNKQRSNRMPTVNIGKLTRQWTKP